VFADALALGPVGEVVRALRNTRKRSRVQAPGDTTDMLTAKPASCLAGTTITSEGGFGSLR
jgi:hypothetical protein